MGLLDARSTFFLAVRLAARLNQALLASGAASSGAGWWQAALPAFVGLDLAVWWALRRSDRFGLGWRLPLDCADMAFWSFSPLPASGRAGFGLLVAMPLAVEAGFRLGRRGLIVPAACLAALAAARSVVDRTFHPPDAGWLVLSVLLGMALWSYCRGLHARAEGERRGRLAAETRRAYLAGQNAVAMGASSAVDALEGLVPIVGRPVAGSALWRLADGWKLRLSQSASQEATYLQVALLEWERAHNRHPDLATLVEIHVAEGHGTTLLTGHQVGWLWQALDSMALAGRCDVAVSTPATEHVPGTSVPLRLGDRLLAIPADRGAQLREVDPGPVTYLFMAVLVALSAFPFLGSLPPAPAAAGIAACMVAGWWSHRRLLRHGAAARPEVFGGAVMVALFLTVLVTLTARRPFGPDGDVLYQFGTGTLLLSFLGGVYQSWLPRRGWVVGSAIAAVVLTGVALNPVPVVASSLVAAIVWFLTPYLPCRRVSAAMSTAGRQYASAIQDEDGGAVEAAFDDGRRSVVELVGQARDDALRQLRQLGPTLDRRLADLAARRLEEVGRRLSTIGSGPESSSSTTTS